MSDVTFSIGVDDSKIGSEAAALSELSKIVAEFNERALRAAQKTAKANTEAAAAQDKAAAALQRFNDQQERAAKIGTKARNAPTQEELKRESELNRLLKERNFSAANDKAQKGAFQSQVKELAKLSAELNNHSKLLQTVITDYKVMKEALHGQQRVFDKQRLSYIQASSELKAYNDKEFVALKKKTAAMKEEARLLDQTILKEAQLNSAQGAAAGNLAKLERELETQRKLNQARAESASLLTSDRQKLITLEQTNKVLREQMETLAQLNSSRGAAAAHLAKLKLELQTQQKLNQARAESASLRTGDRQKLITLEQTNKVLREQMETLAQINSAKSAQGRHLANLKLELDAQLKLNQASAELKAHKDREFVARKKKTAAMQEEVRLLDQTILKEAQLNSAKGAAASNLAKLERELETQRKLNQARAESSSLRTGDRQKLITTEQINKALREQMETLARLNAEKKMSGSAQTRQVAQLREEAIWRNKIMQAEVQQSDSVRRLRAQYERLTTAQARSVSVSRSLTNATWAQNQAMSSLRASMSSLGLFFGVYTSATLLAATASYAFVRSLKEAVSSGMEFEDQLAKVGAISIGSVDSEEYVRSLGAIEQKALQISTTTRFMASEVVDAMRELGMAGMSASEIMLGVEDTMKLAAIGAIDFGRAADIATNVLMGFRLDVDDLGYVVDVMAKAVTDSNQTVEQLGNTLSYAAPVAESFGLSLAAVTASAQVLANSGIKASRAGTGLRRILLSLNEPNTKAAAAMEKYGIAMDDALSGTEAYLDILEQFYFATGGAAQNVELLSETVGVRATPAFIQLVKSMGDGSRSLVTFTKALEKARAAGEGDLMFSRISDTVKAGVLELQSALEALSISAFNTFKDGFKEIISSVTSFVRVLADNSVYVSQLTSAVLGAAKAISQFIAAVLAYKALTGFLSLLKGVWVTAGALAMQYDRLKVAVVGYTAATGHAAVATKAAAGGMAALTFSAKVLRGVLAGLGIGLLVTGLVFAFEKVKALVDGFNEVKKSAKKLQQLEGTKFDLEEKLRDLTRQQNEFADSADESAKRVKVLRDVLRGADQGSAQSAAAQRALDAEISKQKDLEARIRQTNEARLAQNRLLAEAERGAVSERAQQQRSSVLGEIEDYNTAKQNLDELLRLKRAIESSDNGGRVGARQRSVYLASLNADIAETESYLRSQYRVIKEGNAIYEQLRSQLDAYSDAMAKAGNLNSSFADSFKDMQDRMEMQSRALDSYLADFLTVKKKVDEMWGESAQNSFAPLITAGSAASSSLDQYKMHMQELEQLHEQMGNLAAEWAFVQVDGSGIGADGADMTAAWKDNVEKLGERFVYLTGQIAALNSVVETSAEQFNKLFLAADPESMLITLGSKKQSMEEENALLQRQIELTKTEGSTRAAQIIEQEKLALKARKARENLDAGFQLSVNQIVQDPSTSWDDGTRQARLDAATEVYRTLRQEQVETIALQQQQLTKEQELAKVQQQQKELSSGQTEDRKIAREAARAQTEAYVEVTKAMTDAKLELMDMVNLYGQLTQAVYEYQDANSLEYTVGYNVSNGPGSKEWTGAYKGTGILRGIDNDLAERVQRMQEDALQQGINLVVTDALRSKNAGYGSKTSNHQWGGAVDIGTNSSSAGAVDYMRENLAKFGLTAPVSWENPDNYKDHIHIEKAAEATERYVDATLQSADAVKQSMDVEMKRGSALDMHLADTEALKQQYLDIGPVYARVAMWQQAQANNMVDTVEKQKAMKESIQQLGSVMDDYSANWEMVNRQREEYIRTGELQNYDTDLFSLERARSTAGEYDSARLALEEYRLSMAKLNEAKELGYLSSSEYAKGVRDITLEMQRSKGPIAEFSANLVEGLTDAEAQISNILNGIRDSIAEMFKTGKFDWENLFSGIKDEFAERAADTIMVGVTGGFGSLFPSQTAAGQAKAGQGTLEAAGAVVKEALEEGAMKDVTKQGEVTEQAITSVGNDMVSAIYKLPFSIFGAFSGAISALLGAILGGSAAAFTGGSIVQGATQGLGGMGGLGSLGQLFGGNSLGTNLGVGFANTAGKLGMSGNWVGGVTAGLASTPNWAFGAGGLGGSLLGSMMFDGDYVGIASGVGSAAGSAIGAGIAGALALTGPIGAIAGGLLGGVGGGFLGSLFGGEKKPKMQANLWMTNGQVTLGDTNDLSSEAVQQINESIKYVNDAMAAGASSLGQGAIDAISGWNGEFQKTASGDIEKVLGSRYAEGVQKMITGAAQEMGQMELFQPLIDRLQGSTDSALAEQVLQEAIAYKYLIDMQDTMILSLQQMGVVFDSSIQGLKDLSDAFGGLDNMLALQNNFIDKFFNDQEKFKIQESAATSSLNQVNEQYGTSYELPDTRQGFKDLVVGLDVTTAGGQALYATMLSLTDVMDAFYTALEGLSGGVSSLTEQILRYTQGAELTSPSSMANATTGSAAIVDSIKSFYQGDLKDVVTSTWQETTETAGKFVYDFVQSQQATTRWVPGAIDAAAKEGGYNFSIGGWETIIEDIWEVQKTWVPGTSSTQTLTSTQVDFTQNAKDSIWNMFNTFLRRGPTGNEQDEWLGRLDQINGNFGQLVDEFMQTSMYTSAISDSMERAAGGIEKLTEGWDAYQQYFMTDDERQDMKKREAQIEVDRTLAPFIGQDFWGIPNFQAPTSESAFRDLIETIPTVTVHGAELHGALMSLADDFAVIYGLTEETSSGEDVSDRFGDYKKLVTYMDTAFLTFEAGAMTAAQLLEQLGDELAGLDDEDFASYFSMKSPGQQMKLQYQAAVAAILDEFQFNAEGYTRGQFEMDQLSGNLDFSQAVDMAPYLEHVFAFTDGINDAMVGGIDALEKTANKFGIVTDGVQAGLDALIGGTEEYIESVKAAGVEMFSQAGNLADFERGIQTLYETIYSSDEQALRSKELARMELEEAAVSFGYQPADIPDTREELRAIVESIDLSTPGGRELMGQLADLAPQFSILFNETDELAGSISSATDALKDWIDELVGSEKYMASSQAQLGYATQDYNTLYESVSSGDFDKISDLTSASTTLVDLYRDTAGSVQEYNALVGNVLGANATLLRRIDAGLIIENTADPGFASGGVASGPLSGYTATLHGTEAIIPMDRGNVPVVITSGGEGVDELIEEIKELRKEVKQLREEQVKEAKRTNTTLTDFNVNGITVSGEVEIVNDEPIEVLAVAP